MLRKFKITTCAFILCLFGLTLMTVSPVFAADSAAFVECTQLKHPQRNFKQLLNKKNCFRDLAKALVKGGAVAQANGADSPEQVSTSPSGGEVAELNARIVESQSQVATLSGQHVELQSQVATLTTTNAQLQEQLRAASAAAEPLNARIAELEAENATLRGQQGAPADPSGGEVAELNAKISQLEGKPMSSWECAWVRRQMC